ncbi:major facilitator superfamily domain-containing protein [Cokeromyces recurvatus]|uniref:major facilitator superfamily domain-containing protein n=1 Tax=Cokeromyces recurvatus TaxID=90255 RepID=UPI00221E9530|nr:major facilitator superfamily domain-containing protein [Cokeromyces recurvatus]KAI7905453.1 major facilitator superfamily domain-containing protein [Cokeromyces recurvatus]
MFMMSLNSTVVAPAMSIIATDLNALEQQTWIATSYLVAVNSFQPLSGKFSDIFGRKAVFMFGIVFFFIGSLINALSKNISMLIAGRTIQGFGGGGVMSMAYILVTDVCPVNLRPRFQSMLAVVYGIASVVGPLLGGAFVDHASWHWDFWLNVILAAIAFIIIFFYLNETQNTKETSLKDKIKRIDWLGSVFSIGFIVCLLLALNWGASYGWSDAHSIGPFVGAGVSLIGLIISEGWLAKEPLLPAKVLLNPPVTMVYGYMLTLGLTFTGTLYFGPIYFQSVFGANSTESGLRLIPFMVCLIGGSVGCSILLRKFPSTKYYLIIGSACNLLGYGLFYTVNESSTWGQQAGYLAFCGFSFGLSQQNAILTVQSCVELKDIAVATSSNNFFMMLASSVGIAIYQVLYKTFLTDEFAKLPLEVLAIANKYGALRNFLYIREMPLEIQKPVIHAYSQALHKVFILPIAAAGVGFILTLFFKNVRYGESLGSGGDAKNSAKNDVESAFDKKAEAV